MTVEFERILQATPSEWLFSFIMGIAMIKRLYSWFCVKILPSA